MKSVFWIDKVHGCSISENVQLQEMYNECSSLEKMQNGLFYLARSVRNIEEKKKLVVEREGKVSFGSYAQNVEGVDSQEIQLLPNYYNWFANDLINYVRLVGFTMNRINGNITHYDIRHSPKHIRELVDTYVKSVTEIHLVSIHRNKVSAHFAITDPRTENASMRYQSIFYPVDFANGRYFTNVIQIQVENDNESLPQWSVTNVFESLIPRYWPLEHDFFQRRFNGFVVPPRVV